MVFIKSQDNVRSIIGKKVYTCKSCDTTYKRHDQFGVHIRKCKGEPKKGTHNQKKAWNVPIETFSPVMPGANEMLGFSYDDSIYDSDLPS